MTPAVRLQLYARQREQHRRHEPCEDDLCAARGIGNGVAICVALYAWGAAAWQAWRLFA